jgi:hypothetical protein
MSSLYQARQTILTSCSLPLGQSSAPTRTSNTAIFRQVGSELCITNFALHALILRLKRLFSLGIVFIINLNNTAACGLLLCCSDALSLYVKASGVVFGHINRLAPSRLLVEFEDIAIAGFAAGLGRSGGAEVVEVWGARCQQAEHI